MMTDKVKQEGNLVVAEFSSEATAREMAMRIDRGRIDAEGSNVEKLDKSMDDIGNFIDNLSRPHMAIASWVFAVVSMCLAGPSFARLAPRKEFELPLFVVGCLVIYLIKVGAQRWAKADNLPNKGLSDYYRNLVAAGVTIVFLAGVVFQFAVGVDQESGVITVDKQISDLESEIRSEKLQADDMKRPLDTVEDIEIDVTRRLAQPARVKGGELAGMTIGEAVGHGARGEGHRPPDTFCMPVDDKVRQALIDKYCPDLIETEKLIRQRVRYDDAIAAIAAKQKTIESLRTAQPERAGGAAVGQKLASGGADAWTVALVAAVVGAVLLLFIEGFMVFTTYVSKRHPKGVTEALAKLTPDKAAAGATGG